MSTEKIQKIIDIKNTSPEALCIQKQEGKDYAISSINKCSGFILMALNEDGSSDIKISMTLHDMERAVIAMTDVLKALADAKIKSIQITEQKNKEENKND